jgi:glycosyltransferase involved in cell wall biosynthesis
MVMENPLFSVVIPVFNRPELLARALKSLAVQTESNFEVIVVDDGSTSDVKSVADDYEAKLNLKYIRIENSGLPARPRNIGIKASQATWISLLDSDDWWCPTRIAEVCRAIEKNPKYDVFYHKLKVVSGNSYLKWWSTKILGHKMTGDPFVHLMTFGDAIPNSSVVVRKTCYEKFGGLIESSEFASVDDFDYWLMLAKNKCQFWFINFELGFYWLSTTSMSSNPDRTVAGNQLILDKYLKDLDTKYQEKAKSKFYYFAGSVLYSAGRVIEAMNYFNQAKELSGLGLKAKRLWKMARIRLKLR